MNQSVGGPETSASNDIRTYASPMTSAKSIDLTFEIDDKVKDLSLNIEVRKNLYLIMKEAINNAVKYSNCKSLSINIQRNMDKLVCVVKDDGDGFDISSTNGNGNGLVNMKERADRIHADIEIQSTPENGCLIRTQYSI